MKDIAFPCENKRYVYTTNVSILVYYPMGMKLSRFQIEDNIVKTLFVKLCMSPYGYKDTL